jgi:hypothetical protein
MAYPSLAKKFQPLRSAPSDLIALQKTLRGRIARALLGILIRRPSGIVVGTYEWSTKSVTPNDDVLGELPFEGLSISVEALDHAVICLGGIMRFHKLPFGVTRSREAGRGGLPRGMRGGYAYTQERVPYWIGLVDRRQAL